MNNGLVGSSEGWAVMRQFDWGWSFLGPYWFGSPPAYMDHRTAMFHTKKAAQAAVKDSDGPFKIIRVRSYVIEKERS